ncbi:hypothetical protein D918_06253 [Trichuris suis]|nr:hypothetical protein D918_06253 [Trichuris suis]
MCFQLPSVWHVRCPEEKVLPSHMGMTCACYVGKTTAADAAPYLTVLVRYMFHVLNLIMK